MPQTIESKARRLRSAHVQNRSTRTPVRNRHHKCRFLKGMPPETARTFTGNPQILRVPSNHRLCDGLRFCQRASGRPRWGFRALTIPSRLFFAEKPHGFRASQPSARPQDKPKPPCCPNNITQTCFFVRPIRPSCYLAVLAVSVYGRLPAEVRTGRGESQRKGAGTTISLLGNNKFCPAN